MTETYYDVLGIAEDASREDIETAYRERLKETHPDVSDDDDAQTATQRIVEARDVLTDETEREKYDRVGHAAYVGEDPTTPTTDSDAATAARQAGYGTTTGSDSDSAEEGSGESGHDGYSRTDRERRARERVSQGRRRAHTGRETTDPADQTADTSGQPSSADSSGATGTAHQSTQYSVRQEYETTRKPEDIVPSGRELTVLGLSFAFYPVLLASAVFPPFPLWVKVLVGVCAVFVFGYLQSMPRIAVIVFGAWSVLAPLILLGLPFGIFSIVGIFTLCGTWLPFAFSVLTLSILR